jgi:TonB family protein
MKRKLMLIAGSLAVCTAMLGALGFQPASAPGPSPKRIVAFEYPSLARLGGIQGKVVLALRVSSEGSVESVQTVSGVAPLAKPAEEVVSKWRFENCPARDGCKVTLTFDFSLAAGVCDAGARCPSEFSVDLPDRVHLKATRIRAIVD